MSYFDYLKHNVYSTYNEKIILKYNNGYKDSYSYKFKNPVYLVKLDIPDIFINCTLILNGEEMLDIEITKLEIEILKKTDFYFGYVKSILIFHPFDKKDILTKSITINIGYTFKDIRMKSIFTSIATSDTIYNYIDAIYILTNIINSDIKLEPIFINKKDNIAIYKFKFGSFKNTDTNLVVFIKKYLDKYNLKQLYFYIIYNNKLCSSRKLLEYY